MPDTRSVRPTVTREMDFASQLIEQNRKVPEASLAEFIASRRHPSAGPLSWPDISYELVSVLRKRVADGTVRKWALAYGIPVPPRGIKLTAEEYEAGLAEAGIVSFRAHP